jgi:hypothetical protein
MPMHNLASCLYTTISYLDSPVLHWTVIFLCGHRVRSCFGVFTKTLGQRQWPSPTSPRISEGEAGTVNMGRGHWHGYSYYLPHDSQGSSMPIYIPVPNTSCLCSLSQPCWIGRYVATFSPLFMFHVYFAGTSGLFQYHALCNSNCLFA